MSRRDNPEQKLKVTVCQMDPREGELQRQGLTKGGVDDDDEEEDEEGDEEEDGGGGAGITIGCFVSPEGSPTLDFGPGQIR